MGTTSEKLTYLSGTKDKLKTVINAMGGEIDDDTFRSYPENLNDLVLKSINGEIDLFNEYPKKESSGTNITIDGIEEGKALIELNPSELSQDETPTPSTPASINVVKGNNSIKILGKNLFNFNDTYYARSNTTISISGSNLTLENTSSNVNGALWWNIPIEVGKNITVSYSNMVENSSSSNNRVYCYFSSTPISEFTSSFYVNEINKTNKSLTLNATEQYLVLVLRQANGNGYILSDLQVEYRDTNTSCEPYQGQTYPINLGSLEYCKIGDYSDEFALSTGVQLFDKNNANKLNAQLSDGEIIASSSNAKTFYIPIKGGKTYTVSRKAGKRFRVGTTTTTPTIGDSVNNFTKSDASTSITVTTDINANYLCVYYFLNGTDTLTEQEILDSIMINEGSTVLPWEPYGIGNWYLKKNIGKVVLDGTETWSSRTNNVGVKEYYCTTTASDINSDTYISQMCNYGTYSRNTYNSGTVGKFAILTNNYGFYLCVPDEFTLETFKTNIGVTNIIINYVTKATTGIPITDTTLIEQLNNLYNQIKSYKGQTNIIQTNTELPFEITMSALKELDI